MAVDVPVSRIALRPQYFRRGRPVTSGAAAGDKAFGMRGVSSQLNHGWAYRVHPLLQQCPVDADSVAFRSSASAIAYSQIWQPSWHRVGEGVAYLDLVLDCEDAHVYLLTDQGAGAALTQTGRGILTVSFQLVSSGVDVQQSCLFRARAGGLTAHIYRAILRERALVAGDIT